jgi:hypothetical protein
LQLDKYMSASSQADGKEDHYLWLYYLQVSDLNAARGKVWNLKLDVDRPPRLAFASDATHAPSKAPSHPAAVLIITFHTWQTQLCTH